MTFSKLRRELTDAGRPLAVKWTQSDIVEVASLESNGAVRITNVITKNSYILPRRVEVHVEILTDGLVSLGQLFPKSMKRASKRKQEV